ncbi:mucin-17 [Strongylocentrotus purpuratus]|uniref:Uncharacterized protein n=1 Tax=Strongylocentrotus purpuratus TaxID=7668 RepID=A0A7M7RA82_STRPU|nr:mucin-17 [Strongylocentrotus purpuratus]|eukprot:XP_782072.2 PREDICTED: mucin-17 [Strongylocentrotus purpuratus]
MASGNKIVIAFLSVSTESSTDKLIEQIKRENYDFRCVFVKLTRQDLQLFQPGETYDAVVLLHSISQGRNSITDLADAKYSKFLPTLKKIYGPDRVAVVVHSMTSFNSNTKKALMMIFKKSQPTTFQCSKCVIQCNNLAEMLAADLSRLAEFLGEVPDHPLPIPEDEAHSTLTIAPSADKIDRIETGGKPQSIPVFASATTGDQSMTSSALSSTDTRSMSQTEVGRSENASAISFDSGSPVDPLGVGLRTEVAPTQPTKGQTSITSTSSAGTGDGNTQNMASSTSQLGACSSYTAQASPKFDTSSYGYATQDTLIDTTYPIASVDLSSINSTSSASTGDVNPQNMASSTSQLGACSSDTAQVSQPPPKVDTSPNRYDTQEKVIDTTYPIASVDLSSINSTSSASTGDVNPQNMASSTSQLGACSSDTAQVSQPPPKVDTSPNRYDTQEKVIDTTYPIASVHLSSINSTSSVSTGDVNPQNMASSTSQLDAFSSDTAQVSQPPPKVDTSPNRYDTQEKVIDTTFPIASVDLSSINSTSYSSTENVNPKNMASSTSQLGACSSDTAQVSQASPKVDTSPERYAAQDKVIDTAYPIALVNLSSENQPTTLKDDLQRRLPGKTIMLIKDINDLASNWHLFEAILLDLGSLQEAASYSSDEYKGALHIYQKCLKEMLVPQNLALLMLAPVDTHSADKHADIIRMISEIGKTREVSVFQYSRESCKPSLFDDNTKNRLFFWILDCYPRYHAAALQKGPGPSKNMQTQLAKYFPSISRLF